MDYSTVRDEMIVNSNYNIELDKLEKIETIDNLRASITDAMILTEESYLTIKGEK